MHLERETGERRTLVTKIMAFSLPLLNFLPIVTLLFFLQATIVNDEKCTGFYTRLTGTRAKLYT